MHLLIKNEITITGTPSNLAGQIRQDLTIPNPAYADAEKMNRWTGNIPRTITFYRQTPDDIVVPRGYFPKLVHLARQTETPFQILDTRRTLPEVDFPFSGTLRPYQSTAVSDMLKYPEGVLNCPTGGGKTIMALAIIAARRQPTLIICHTKELLEQWKQRINEFLSIPCSEIGQIGNGKKVVGKAITIGIINSIYPLAGLIKSNFGHIVIDECHRTPSRSFTDALGVFDAKFITGLSATPYRRDGLTKVIYLYCGNQQASIDRQALENVNGIVPARVVLKDTNIYPYADPAEAYSQALSELCESNERNTLIAGDVAREGTNATGACLCLTDRKEHAERLSQMIQAQGVKSEVLTGDTPQKNRIEIVERVNAGEVKVLIATGQLIGEGFDCKHLSTLFLAVPVSYHGRLIQYLGRVLRPAPGKNEAVIYDYIDAHGVFEAAARKRLSVYRDNNWITN